MLHKNEIELFGEAANETGVVLLEWTIVVVGLILGLLMFFDLANMLVCYVDLSQGAYEGVRAGQSLSQLEPGTTTDLIPTVADIAECTTNTSSVTFPCGHYFMQERVRYSVVESTATTSWTNLTGPLSITCSYIPAGGAGGASDENTVTVSTTGRFTGFFFRNFPISVSNQGPYLFIQ